MDEILAGLIGAAVAGAITWLTTSLRLRHELELLYDRDLRDKRVTAYNALWRRTKRLPRSRLAREVTGQILQEIREDWHNWYYDEGGIYMSETVRANYFRTTDALESVADEFGNGELAPNVYAKVYDHVKALRDSLTSDIGARLDPQLLRRSWLRSK